MSKTYITLTSEETLIKIRHDNGTTIIVPENVAYVNLHEGKIHVAFVGGATTSFASKSPKETKTLFGDLIDYLEAFRLEEEEEDEDEDDEDEDEDEDEEDEEEDDE